MPDDHPSPYIAAVARQQARAVSRPLALALLAFATGLIGLVVWAVLVVGDQADRISTLEARSATAARHLAAERRARRDLSALVCVMAHVDDRADHLVIGGYERLGHLDRRAYLPDYPRC